MKIAILQFSPVLGKVSNNVARIKAIISQARQKAVEAIDLLVLPEMAVSGYDFPDVSALKPHLESRTGGTTLTLARELNEMVPSRMTIIGYPESDDTLYNSAMVVQKQQVIYNHRKKHLYETDERWAAGGSTFGHLDVDVGQSKTLSMALGICMDLNPYRFQAPSDAYEFGNHCVKVKADLIVVSMAWLEFVDAEPLDAARYWLARLGPVLNEDRRITIVFCNRTGSEGSTTYHGHSCVVVSEDGKLNIMGMMGREEGLLVVDTAV